MLVMNRLHCVHISTFASHVAGTNYTLTLVRPGGLSFQAKGCCSIDRAAIDRVPSEAHPGEGLWASGISNVLCSITSVGLRADLQFGVRLEIPLGKGKSL